MKISSYRILLFVLLIVSSSVQTKAQSEEYLLKAGFIERFTRFINWPEDSLIANPDLPFKILVLGENPFGDILNRFYSDTKIKNREVSIFYSENDLSVADYHMLFICNSEDDRLKEILKQAEDIPVLTIGDTDGFGKKGVLINFYLESNKIRFEINKKAFERSQLEVSHLLLNVAKVID